MSQTVVLSPNTKWYLLLGFCMTVAFFFLSRSIDSEMEDTPKIVKMTPEAAGLRRTGGLGEMLQEDERVKGVVEQIKPILEEKSGIKFASIDIIHYRPQVVAGTNYFVKAKAKQEGGEEQIVHLRIYQDLKRNLELTAYQLGKALEDKLEYFQ